MGFAGITDDGLQNHYLNEFAKCGIARERLELSGPKPYSEYLKEYNKMDILLDTFPENGGTYTCESLWMGVPVITLAGERQIGRYGLSLLSQIGLEDFVARTASDYVTKAVALASDMDNLKEMRASMRSRLTISPLCDAKQFAQNLESTYREMWNRWSREHRASAPVELSV